MKILQVIPYYYPAFTFGGPLQVVYHISKELVNRGHEVVVYTSDARDLTSRLIVDHVEIIDDVTVHYFKNVSMLPVKQTKLFITPSLIANVRDNISTFDVIHLHEYRSFQNIVTHHYARKMNVPYLLQAHGSLPKTSSRVMLKSIYDTLFGHALLEDAAKVIALSQREATQYADMGVSEDRISIIPNGLDISAYDTLPPKGLFKKKFHIPSEKQIILYLGRIHETKRIDYLIQAYAYIKNEMKLPNTCLVIIGPDDGYLSDVKALADSLKLSDSIFFIGYIDEEDKLKAYVDADVFVTPSFSGFPITFLEACATGTPIVTTSLGDTLEWIDGTVGYTSSPTYAEMAKWTAKILTDSEVRAQYSENCTKIVRSLFSMETIVDSLEKVYGQIK